jgi:FtsZ-interacting cell division protein ZipA
MKTWVWIVIAIVVILIIAAIVMAAMRKKKEQNRNRAGEIRQQAASQATDVQRREAEARETEARAAQARAQAERLEADAKDKSSTAEQHRNEHLENLQRADEMDPDVNTKSKDYEGPDTSRTYSSDGTGDTSDRNYSSTEGTNDEGTYTAREERTEVTEERGGPDNGSHRV